jgi:acyl-CoA synthetase (AMP-forming)/AMP-acid ligase II/endonuclease/exonuclease/phosphatase family metal-dependent hydrolase
MIASSVAPSSPGTPGESSAAESPDSAGLAPPAAAVPSSRDGTTNKAASSQRPTLVPSRRRRRLPAAALIPLRIRQKQVEVLVGQIEVLDGVTSSPGGGMQVNPFPGEYRLPARQHRSTTGSPNTPLETACEELEELGVPIPKEGIQATLFAKESVQTESRDYRVLYFVACEEDNGDVFRTPIRTINLRLRELRRQRREMMLDGTYWDFSRAEKERLSPKLHHLEWKKLRDVLKDSDPGRQFVNEYQQEQFIVYGVKARHPGRDMLAVLERIAKLGSLENIRQHAIENLVRTVANAKELSEETWRAQLEEDVDIMKGVNEISLLSYNLNCLPFGVSLFSTLTLGSLTDQGFASQERIEQFVHQVAQKKFDIIALQEVFATPALAPFCRQRYLIRKMRKLGYTNIVQSRPLGMHRRVARRKWTDSGLLILSRLPIETQDDMLFPESAIGLDAGATKGVVYARVRTVERALHVFNCHLQATHTGEGDYASVRSQQLKALRDFITKKTFGTRDPWVLTGDFNIDAIATTDDHTGEFGFAFQAPRSQSEAYDWLMKTISPRGDVINLLHETEGRHVCTRPPRLSFPRSAAYAFKHKYPQCLDYIFFCNGSVGSIKRTMRSTQIEKFPAEVKSRPSGGRNLAGRVCVALAGAVSVGTLRLSTQDHDWSMNACVLLAIVNLLVFVVYHVRSKQAQLTYDYLSDHFGVSTSFSAEVTYNWQNLVPSLSPMQGDKPVHQQRADALKSVRPYVQLMTSAGVSGICHFGALDRVEWDNELSQPIVFSMTLVIGGLVAYVVDRLVLRIVNLIKRDPGASNLLSVLGMCAVPCQEPTPPRSRLGSTTQASTVREPPKTVYDCLLQGVELYGNLPCLAVREKRADGALGEYMWISYDETSQRAKNFGSGLKCLSEELGGGLGGRQRSASGSGANLDKVYYGPNGNVEPMVQPDRSPKAGDTGATSRVGLIRGDHIGIVSENCREWLIVDHACAKYSLVSVPLETHGREFFSKLVQHSKARVIVASKSWISEVINRFAEGLCPLLQFVVQIEQLEYDEQVRAQDVGLPIYSFGFVERKGELHRHPVEQPLPDDVYTVAYRWHSHTGEPIGWEVTHRNLAANATGIGDLYRFSPKETHFSYVPMSHIGERVVIAACLQNGAKIGIFGSSVSSKIYADLKKLKPTFLLSTPHMFSAPLVRHWQALERAPLRYWATVIGLRFKSQKRFRRGCCSKAIIRLMNHLIFSNFIEQLGGNLKRIFVLSDATLNYMDHHFETQTQIILDCPVFKVLVLPEAGGFLAVSEPDSRDRTTMDRVLHENLLVKLKPLPNAEMLGIGDGMIGELLLKGPSLSSIGKSFAQPTQDDATADAPKSLMRRSKSSASLRKTDSVTFDRLNWVHTGIICEVVDRKVASPGTWNVHFPDISVSSSSASESDGSRGLHAPPHEPTSATLRVVGRVSSIVEVGDERRPVLAEEVERIYRSRVARVRQIWCHAPEAWQRWSARAVATDGEGVPSIIGMCAVVCIDHEQVHKWLGNAGVDLGAEQRKRDQEKHRIMAASEAWFSRSGRGDSQASMVAADAWQHSKDEWSVRYTLRPDTGSSYLRRLCFRTTTAEDGSSCVEVTGTSAQEARETERLSEMEMICELPELRNDLLAEMHAVYETEDSLPDEAQILTLHLTAESFNAANKLQTPNFRLCRPNLVKRYSSALGLALPPDDLGASRSCADLPDGGCSAHSVDLSLEIEGSSGPRPRPRLDMDTARARRAPTLSALPPTPTTSADYSGFASPRS